MTVLLASRRQRPVKATCFAFWEARVHPQYFDNDTKMDGISWVEIALYQESLIMELTMTIYFLLMSTHTEIRSRNSWFGNTLRGSDRVRDYVTREGTPGAWVSLRSNLRMLEYAFKIVLPSLRNVLQSNLPLQNQKLLPITLVLAFNRDTNP